MPVVTLGDPDECGRREGWTCDGCGHRSPGNLAGWGWTHCESCGGHWRSTAAAREIAAVSKEEDGGELSVVVGTLEQHLPLAADIARMVNDAYGRARIGLDDIRGRLQGGGAAEPNRVLHLCFRGTDELVGCVSSTFQAGWTAAGCGHWGLLVVAVAVQGGGVGSALVRAAEARLVGGGCAQVQALPVHGLFNQVQPSWWNMNWWCIDTTRRRCADVGGCTLGRCRSNTSTRRATFTRSGWPRGMRGGLDSSGVGTGATDTTPSRRRDTTQQLLRLTAAPCAVSCARLFDRAIGMLIGHQPYTQFRRCTKLLTPQQAAAS